MCLYGPLFLSALVASIAITLPDFELLHYSGRNQRYKGLSGSFNLIDNKRYYRIHPSVQPRMKHLVFGCQFKIISFTNCIVATIVYKQLLQHLDSVVTIHFSAEIGTLCRTLHI